MTPHRSRRRSNRWQCFLKLLAPILKEICCACCCCSCHFKWVVWILWRNNGYLWGQTYLHLCNSKGEKAPFCCVWCAMLWLVLCWWIQISFLPLTSFLRLIFFFLPPFTLIPGFLSKTKGVCGRASLHAVLCHQTANGEGTHRLHHWRGTLFPQWGQTHQTADWIQDAGESQAFIKKKKRSVCIYFW